MAWVCCAGYVLQGLVDTLSAGELAIKVSSEQLQPVATAIVERLVPILAASTSLPRSILENRWAACKHQLCICSQGFAALSKAAHQC